RHGYDRKSIREPLASPFYDVRHRVSRALHAIDRNRILTGLALGYAPDGELDFGLDGKRLTVVRGEPYGILLHATARPEKEWPEDRWVALGNVLAEQGFDLILPWGTAAEKARSERIAAAVPRAGIPERKPLDT